MKNLFALLFVAAAFTFASCEGKKETAGSTDTLAADSVAADPIAPTVDTAAADSVAVDSVAK
jgi:hypothetical protein